jgi:ABC-2 type transport system ATP-binding protein
MPLAIEVTGLTKRYDTGTALDDIAFSVQPGEIMGFLGPNGAGKTTALRILTGMLAPTSGTVRIDGLDVADKTLEVRRRIGYMPENVALYPELRIQEYLHYRAQLKGVPGVERRRRVQEVLEQCALTDVPRKLIGRLSKGYRQRVALADCLVGKPRILILDEPTVGLDPHQIRQTRELITQLGRTTTILLSTHILPEVEMTCQRVTIINQGRIVAVDTPSQLRQRMQGTTVVRVELKAEPSAVQHALRQLPGVVQVSLRGEQQGYVACELQTVGEADVREALYQLAVAQRWPLRELTQSRVSLEDVFIHLTTHE